MLGALGVDIADDARIDAAIEVERRRRWRRLVEPVSVARGGFGVLRLRLPSIYAEATMRCDLLVEGGAQRSWDAPLDEIEAFAAATVDGETFVLKHVRLPDDLPLGYHSLTVSIGRHQGDTLIISAPDGAATAEKLGRPRGWGAFLPLYALRSDDDWGIGDFGHLAEMAEWIGDCGGNVVATLPLLPTDASALSGASPYSAVSRLFWSELFVDLSVVPELLQCAAAERLVRSPEAQHRLAALRSADEVEYAEIATLKRTLLIEMAAVLLSAAGDGERRARFESFLERRPEVHSYARFRAVLLRHGRPWSDWPAPMRDGLIRAQDGDEAVYRSHLFGQWLAHEQLEGVAARMQRRDMSLYLDLPLGVPHDSFDVWRHRDQFVSGASAGAPPDNFFLQGQNWALPPAHPEHSREHGYGYLRACLEHHLSTAGMLRIDHVMALHRLFWVPDGFAATEGVYVRYPARELWAILALESQRNKAVIVGEDLGTVPRAVRRAMRRNRTHRIFVLQTEIAEDRLPCLTPPAPDSIACMNTHDMPTFASYRQAGDVRDLADLGVLDDTAVAAESSSRAAKLRVLSEFLRHGGWLAMDSERPGDAEVDRPANDAEGDGFANDAEALALLRACLGFMAESEASALIVNLEDLWLEERPHNVPGTNRERPNWRRRARYTLAEMKAMPGLGEALRELDRGRGARPRNEPSEG